VISVHFIIKFVHSVDLVILH